MAILKLLDLDVIRGRRFYFNTQQIKIPSHLLMFQVQEELNNTRVKLIEKEREVERLDTQMKAATKGKAAQLKRQGSQDLSEKLEKEAQSLRERTNMLEQENEKLAHENRQLLKDQVIKAMYFTETVQ